MTLIGAQATTPGEGNQPQDPKGGEGSKPQDPNAGTKPQDPSKGEGNKSQNPKTCEGDPQEPKVDHKLEADNRRLLSYLHSIVYVKRQIICHDLSQKAKMHNKKGKRHKIVCPVR